MSKVLILKFVIIFYSVFAIIASTSLMIIGLYFKNKGQRLNCRLSFITAGITILPVVIAFILWIDMRYIEPNWIGVKAVNIKADNFSEGLQNIKFVQLSDLHIEEIGFKERSLIKIVNKLKPDVIFITGDFIISREGLNPCFEVLSQLKAKKGIFAILGNWEYYNHSEREFVTRLKNIGITTLLHGNLKLDFGKNGAFWLIGISDKYGEFALDGEFSYVVSAFRYIPIQEPKVLMIHDPNVAGLKIIAQYKPQLILAGHTHGGQLGISFFRRYVSYDHYTKYINGLFYVQGIPLYVNRGIGMIVRPLRFFCRPEITVIKLSKA